MSETRTIPRSPANATLPTFTIKVNGEAVPKTFTVLSAVVTREVNKIPRLNLVMHDGSAALSDFKVSNEEFFIPGNEIEIWVGYNMHEELSFKGITIKHSLKIRDNGTTSLHIQAADKAIVMTGSPKRKYFTEVRDSDVFSSLATDHGLQSDIENTDVKHLQLMQYYCSDWDFLLVRAEVNGMLCFCDQGKLIVKKPDLDAEPKLQLHYGSTIIDLDAEIDATEQYSAVKTYSWNTADQALVETQANEPAGLQKAGNIPFDKLSDVVQSAPYSLVHTGTLTEQEAQAWGDALLMKSRLAKIRGTASFSGYNGLTPGEMVSLAGLGDRFNGAVFVSGVKHELTAGRWLTSIQFGLSPRWFTSNNHVQPLAASGVTPGVKGLQIGVVDQLQDDPEGEFRVKVKIPVVDMGGEGIWCRMLFQDAGKDHGFFFMPEIGDEVVVSFLNEDPSYPVIIGSLYSSSRPAKIDPTDENHQKGMTSRSGMQWMWNDDKKTFLTSTPAGNKILLSEDEKTVQLEDQNGNKIIMNSDGISIESKGKLVLKSPDNMTFETSANLEGKASGIKLAGNANAEISSGGNTIVKGSMVMIN